VKLRTKILSTYLLLTVVGVVLVGVVTAFQIQTYLERHVEADLGERLTLVIRFLSEEQLWLQKERRVQLSTIAEALHSRITIIDRSGIVFYDSQVPDDSLSYLQNHLHRAEIQQASKQTFGIDRRQSQSVGNAFFYMARRIPGASTGRSDSVYVRVARSLEEVEGMQKDIFLTIGFVMFLAIVLIGFVSIRLSKTATRPIVSIVQTAKAIRDGDLEQRIPILAQDELGELSGAINEMAQTLSNDIRRLQRLEQVRSEFLGNVSHELRTPLFSLQGFLETLIDGAVDDPAVNRPFLEKALHHAHRLNALLHDLIQISSIESREMIMSFRYFSVREFLESCVAEMKSLAEKRGVRLSTDIGEDVRVYGDRDRLKQVMTNLVDNAIKYTTSGGTVKVRARAANDLCIISVQDTGIGIPEEHIPRISERFYRVDRDRSRGVGGTGLGLAIVKHIVEAHESQLRIQSTVNDGSTFSFALKRA